MRTYSESTVVGSVTQAPAWGDVEHQVALRWETNSSSPASAMSNARFWPRSAELVVISVFVDAKLAASAAVSTAMTRIVIGSAKPSRFLKCRAIGILRDQEDVRFLKNTDVTTFRVEVEPPATDLALVAFKTRSKPRISDRDGGVVVGVSLPD